MATLTTDYAPTHTTHHDTSSWQLALPALKTKTHKRLDPDLGFHSVSHDSPWKLATHASSATNPHPTGDSQPAVEPAFCFVGSRMAIFAFT